MQVIEINLSSIVPHVSGPKRSQDRVAVSSMKEDFQSCLNEKVAINKYTVSTFNGFFFVAVSLISKSFCSQVGFKGFHISKEKQEIKIPFLHCGQEYQLAHGSVVIAAVISCTNNCNPSAMLTAGKG